MYAAVAMLSNRRPADAGDPSVRSPYGGRSAETLAGEEPYLGVPLADAYVRGLKSVRVASVVKHFALNNQETNRFGGTSSDASSYGVEVDVTVTTISANVAVAASSALTAIDTDDDESTGMGL